jgi:hypothetical protein
MPISYLYSPEVLGIPVAVLVFQVTTAVHNAASEYKTVLAQVRISNSVLNV